MAEPKLSLLDGVLERWARNNEVLLNLVRLLPERGLEARAMDLTWTGAAGLIVLIGLSRLSLGVHYPSDVLAGWLGGIAWTALLVLIFHMLGILVEGVPGLREAEPELKRGGVAEAVPPR